MMKLFVVLMIVCILALIFVFVSPVPSDDDIVVTITKRKMSTEEMIFWQKEQKECEDILKKVRGEK